MNIHIRIPHVGRHSPHSARGQHSGRTTLLRTQRACVLCLCARVRACAGAAESFYIHIIYIYVYIYIYIYIYIHIYTVRCTSTYTYVHTRKRRRQTPAPATCNVWLVYRPRVRMACAGATTPTSKDTQRNTTTTLPTTGLLG